MIYVACLSQASSFPFHNLFHDSDDFGQVAGGDGSEPDFLRIDHYVGACRADAEAPGVRYANRAFPPPFFDLGLDRGLEIRGSCIPAGLFFAVSRFGANEEMAYIGGGALFHGKNPIFS